MKRRGNGEGTVFFDESANRWKAKTSASIGKRKTFSGRTQREALDRRAKWLKAHGHSISRVNDRTPLAEYLPAWAESHKINVRVRTSEGYSDDLNNFLGANDRIGKVKLGDVTPSQIQGAIDEIAKKSRWAAQKALRTLAQAFDRAIDLGHLGSNPCAKVMAPKPEAAPFVPPSPDDLSALLKAIHGDRLEALWLTFLAAGLRKGEALALSKSDVNLEIGTVTIRRSLQRVRKGGLQFLPVKSKRGYRTVAIPDMVVTALRRHLRNQLEERMKAGPKWEEHDLVFTTPIGTPIDPRNALRMFQALVPKRRLHFLRHTAISMMLAGGVDIKTVQDVAGHARATTTIDTYGHLLPGTTGRAAAVMDAQLRKAMEKE